ncbi:10124_t:CDS:1, partial [Funneliformis geosporum]
KSKHWWLEVLPSYDPNRFKKILRMFPHNFLQLSNLIRFHPVFLSQGTKPQVCIELQLAVFLCRLGSTGSLFGVCSRFGLGEGTVILYTKRVIQAILTQKNTFLKWPTLEERRKVNKGFENLGGLKNVIGAIDGTHILMKNAPSKDSEVYFTRKKRYAIHCQGIVNYRGIFISFDVGWPGSVHDARVYRNSSFYKNYSNLIQEDDYLLGDSAYPISPFLIPPFKDPNSQRHKDFNQFHSSHRVVVENAFGRLKARFGVLRDLDIKT